MESSSGWTSSTPMVRTHTLDLTPDAARSYNPPVIRLLIKDILIELVLALSSCGKLQFRWLRHLRFPETTSFRWSWESKGFPHPQPDLQEYPGTNLWWSRRSRLFFESQWQAQEHTDPFTRHCWPRLWLIITSNKTIYEIIKRKLKPNLHASRRRQEINK